MQQAALTDTMLDVPTLSTTTKPDLAEQFDVVGAGGLADAEGIGQVADAHAPAGEVDSVCSRRTRVGSASDGEPLGVRLGLVLPRAVDAVAATGSGRLRSWPR